MRVLVTGGTGFIGTPLARALHENGHTVAITSRRQRDPAALSHITRAHVVPELDAGTNWTDALEGQDVVIHLAARTHVMNEIEKDPLRAYRAVNVDATRRLAEQAARLRVKRVVFMSSIKVNGEETGRSDTGEMFHADDAPAPEDAYGQSKWEAEQALTGVAEATGLETVTLRPPLVYGPGVKGNFLSLLKLSDTGLPLPLGSIHNARSLVSVENLVSAVMACATHSKAAGQTFLVRDGEDVSTPTLIRALREVLGRPVRLFPCPVAVLRVLATLVGQRGKLRRLAGSLRVDDSPIRKRLDWSPPSTLAEGLRKTAAWYTDTR